MFALMQSTRLESLHLSVDSVTGLKAVIAIHNSRLGPALGGCRYLAYPNDESAVEEAYLFEKALQHYRGQRWEDAERLLAELATASPHTKLYTIYRERVFQFRYNPPEEQWSGVWVFKTK